MFDKLATCHVTNNVTRVALILSAILVIYWGVVNSRPPVHPNPQLATVSRLRMVYQTIRVFEEKSEFTIGEQLRQVPGSTSLQQSWERLISKRLISPSKGEILSYCRDAYGPSSSGTLFNMEFTTNVISRGANPALTNTGHDVVVWSSGANGINEYGKGDDVVVRYEGEWKDPRTQ